MTDYWMMNNSSLEKPDKVVLFILPTVMAHICGADCLSVTDWTRQALL